MCVSLRVLHEQTQTLPVNSTLSESEFCSKNFRPVAYEKSVNILNDSMDGVYFQERWSTEKLLLL